MGDARSEEIPCDTSHGATHDPRAAMVTGLSRVRLQRRVCVPGRLLLDRSRPLFVVRPRAARLTRGGRAVSAARVLTDAELGARARAHYLTPTEVAERLQIPVRTARIYMHQVVHLNTGHHLRVSEQALRAWEARHTWGKDYGTIDSTTEGAPSGAASRDSTVMRCAARPDARTSGRPSPSRTASNGRPPIHVSRPRVKPRLATQSEPSSRSSSDEPAPRPPFNGADRS